MQFSITRMKKLIQRDWIVYKKPALYSLILVVLSSLFIFWLPTIDNHDAFKTYDTGFWVGWYLTYLFVGGLLLASIIFWEFKSPAGRIQYLSLPTSNFEKFVSRAIYPLIVYPVFLTLILFIAVTIAKSTSSFDNLDNKFWSVIPFVLGGYMSLAALMLVFSIALNKYVAPKAVILSWITFFLFLGLGYLIFRLVMFELFTGFSLNHDYTLAGNNDNNFDGKEIVETIGLFILWIVIPVFFSVVSYFKMKEKQV